MNELKELEEWLVTAIKDNDALFEYATHRDDKKRVADCVTRALAYDSVLRKIHAIQDAQERGEI